ncbi:MAG: hypothetical protein HYV03_05430, partial [Deltaproteobacteria bacterium]|nr:hypothetical protein [Deltaproteobacteria bacterium]
MRRTLFLASILCCLPIAAQAARKVTIGYQGLVEVQSTAPEDAAGFFKFAIIDAAGSTLWSNDGTSLEGSEPESAVEIPVVEGVFNLLLGDDGLTNMTAIPLEIFNTDGELALRVWFNDGKHGFEQLSPDQRLAVVPFAARAEMSAAAAGNVAVNGDTTVPELLLQPVTNAADLGETTTGRFFYDGTTNQFKGCTNAGCEPLLLGLANGDITAVTASSGLTGGGTSGAVSLAVDPSLVVMKTGDQTIAGGVAASGFTTTGQVSAGAVTATTLQGNSGLLLRETTAASPAERITLRAPTDLAADYILTLPVDDGLPGQLLGTDGGGGLSWIDQTTGDVTGVAAGNGLTGGGTVGDLTLNVGGGTGISVGADTIAIDTAVVPQLGAANIFTVTGTAITLKPGSAPVANAKLLDLQLTGVGGSIFSVDYEGDLLATSLELATPLGDASVSDNITIGAGGSVADAALSASVSKLGGTIEGSEITNGTIAAVDIGADAVSLEELAADVAGAGLTGGGGAALAIGAGTGIDVNSDDVSIDQSTTFTWSGLHSWTRTVTDTGSVQDVNLTLGDDSGDDTVSAVTIDVSSAATGDSDTVYGLNIGDLTGADGTVAERALRIGANWDVAIDLNGTMITPTELARLDGTSANLVDQDDTPAAGDLSGSFTAGFQIGADAVGAPEIAANSVGSSELAISGVTAGTYALATITVDEDGRITSASAGSESGDITAVGDAASGAAFVDDASNGSELVYEGASVDGFETRLTFTGDPGSDAIVTIPNVTGTIVTTGDAGTVTTALLANDAVTSVKLAAGVAGSGLTGGGGSALAVNLTGSGSSGNTTANAGLEVGAGGLALLRGCGDGEMLKWNLAASTWGCAGDLSGGTPAWNTIANPTGNLALALGANTSTLTFNAATGGNDLFTLTDTTGNTGTGSLLRAATTTGSAAKPLQIVARGNAIIDTSAAGGITIGNATAAQAVTVDAGTGTLNLGTSSNAKTINLGTAGANTITIGSAGATGVAITDDNWSVSAAGAASLTGLALGSGTITGAGLTDCDDANQKLGWDAATSQFTCITNFPDTASFTDSTTEVATFTAAMDLWDGTYPNITPLSTASTVLVSIVIRGTSDDAADQNPVFTVRRAVGVNPTCTSTQVGSEFVGSFLTTAAQDWGATATFLDSPGTISEVRYTVCTGTTGLDDGNTDDIRVTLVVLGADLAENYYTADASITAGDVVSLDAALPAGVAKGNLPYDPLTIGVVSTAPGHVLDDAIGRDLGKPVPVALAGRVPVRVTTNGARDP